MKQRGMGWELEVTGGRNDGVGVLGMITDAAVMAELAAAAAGSLAGAPRQLSRQCWLQLQGH